MNTIAPPPIIPAIAPGRLIRFQKSEKSIRGPNVAPKPAHANDTILNIALFSSSAITIAISAITKSVILMHHGAIRVDSVEGEGSTFMVRIPLIYIP